MQAAAPHAQFVANKLRSWVVLEIENRIKFYAISDFDVRKKLLDFVTAEKEKLTTHDDDGNKARLLIERKAVLCCLVIVGRK